MVNGRPIEEELNRIDNYFDKLSINELEDIAMKNSLPERKDYNLNIGDTVYLLSASNIIFPAKIYNIIGDIYVAIYKSNFGGTDEFNKTDIGDTVFLTIEDARKRRDSRKNN